MTDSSPSSSRGPANAIEPVLAIALNTFRETVRDRIIYALILFAAIVTVLGIILGSLSVGQDIRILKDIGLAAISLIGGIIAVFAGTNLVYKELERRTIYIIFTKPVSGWQFVLGKYIGLCLCVLVMVAAMGAFLSIIVASQGGGFAGASFLDQLKEITQELSLIYLELLFVTALATFFSTFSTPVMSVLFTLSLWLAGHLGESLLELGKLSQNPFVAQCLSVIFYCLPDFAGLTRIRGHLLYGTVPGTEVLTYLITYLLAYVLMLLVLAAIVTERKEFT
ncbi:MAG: ABC transporter permease [Candidatus Obscuribacterales bacterium]|nr:ABC transporter permease [Candidatus Obscuribacterales bacterium]